MDQRVLLAIQKGFRSRLGTPAGTDAEEFAWKRSQTGSVDTARVRSEQPYIDDPYRFPFVDTIEYYSTSACNLGCGYCYLGPLPAKTRSVDRDPEGAIRVLRGLFEADRIGPQLNLLFIGGEPLLAFRGMRAISEEALRLSAEHDVTLKVHLTTNGTIFTREILEWVEKLNCSVTLSHDGALQQGNRPTKSAGTRLKTADWIAAVSPHRISAQATLLPIQYGEQIDVYEFLTREGFSSIRINLAAGLRSYTSLDIENCVCGILDLYSHCCSVGRFERNLQMALDGVMRSSLARSHCGAGQSHLVLTAEGEIKACANAEIGPIGTTVYDVDEDPVCSSCDLRYLCNGLGGGCRAWRVIRKSVGPDPIDCAASATRIILALKARDSSHHAA